MTVGNHAVGNTSIGGEVNLPLLRSTSTYATGSSTVIRVVDLFEKSGSHGTSTSSNSSRTVDLLEGVNSNLSGAEVDSSGLIDVSYGVNSFGNKPSSNAVRIVEIFEEPRSFGATTSSNSSTTIDLLEGVNSNLSGTETESSGMINVSYGVNSFADNSSSNNIRIVELFEEPRSFGTTTSSNSSRTVDLLEGTKSSSTPITQSIQRNGVSYDPRSIDTQSSLIGAESTALISVLIDLNSTVSTSSSSNDRIVNYEDRSFDSYLSGTKGNSNGVIDVSYGVDSYENNSSSDSIRVVDLSKGTGSHGATLTTDSIRVVDLLEGINSDAKKAETDSIGIIDVFSDVDSFADNSRSFTYNERTSLELLDYSLTWDDDKAVWYTPWVNEYRVLGDEDRFVVKSAIVDDSKRPAALIVIQYDKERDGTVTKESDPIRVDQEEKVHEVTDIPVSDTGRYRMKIMEYSGYNSLISLDMGIIH